MKRVTGFGGLFFRCKDPEAMKAWYSKHLGIDAGQYGYSFEWRAGEKNGQSGFTAWSTFSEDTKYFGPGQQTWMANYRVDDLVTLLAVLGQEGVEIAGEMESFEYGKFAWIADPEGNRIELWEPNDVVYAAMLAENQP